MNGKLNKDNFYIFHFYKANTDFFMKAFSDHKFFERCHKKS